MTLPLPLDMATLERVVLRPGHLLTEAEFFDLCGEHSILRIEKNSEGDVIVMPPHGAIDGLTHFKVAVELHEWAEADGRGIVFSCQAGITLPDSSVFAPDAFWLTRKAWRDLSLGEQESFAAIIPPFVIEVRSRTDRKRDLQDKMRTYMRNGVELGWLIDPISKTVTIYRAGEAEPIELDNPAQVTGEGPVAGFVLDLHRVYSQL